MQPEKEGALAEPKELELDAQFVANAVALATDGLTGRGEAREAELQMSTATSTAAAEASLRALDFAYFTSTDLTTQRRVRTHAAAQHQMLPTATTTPSPACPGCHRGYDDPRAHELELRDVPLMSAWRQAILGNAALFRGATVLDVGCGLGALSLLCAKAGAKRVFAVDGSKVSAEITRKAAQMHGYGGVIEVFEGTLEALVLDRKVDIIVGNWMGPMLYGGGGMLGAVATARDRFLKRGGVVLPDRGSLFVSGVEDRQHLLGSKQAWASHLQGWSPDLDLSQAVMEQMVRQPRVDSLQRSSQLVTNTVLLHELDVLQLLPTQSSLTMSAPFTLTAKRDERLFGLMLHFDAAFTFRANPGSGSSSSSSPTDSTTTESATGSSSAEASGSSSSGSSSAPVNRRAATDTSVVLSTAPSSPSTHYQQLILDFPKSITMTAGSSVKGKISCQPAADNKRYTDVDVEVEYNGTVATAQYRLFDMWQQHVPLQFPEDA
ncbi:MAG: hypothetical protein WDW38_005801 [Sanguina aurantia]